MTNSDCEAEGIPWWVELTGRGGEGMVAKPLEFLLKLGADLCCPP